MPVFLPGESHGQRSLVGYSPWGCKELDMTEWLTLSLFFQENKILIMNHKSLILSVKIELVLESTKFDFFPEFYHELFKHTANLKDFPTKQLQLYLNSTITILVLLISSPINLSQQLSNHIIFMPFKINRKYQIINIMVYCMCVCMLSCVWLCDPVD